MIITPNGFLKNKIGNIESQRINSPRFLTYDKIVFQKVYKFLLPSAVYENLSYHIYDSIEHYSLKILFLFDMLKMASVV